MRFLPAIEESLVIEQILRHLALCTYAYPMSPLGRQATISGHLY